MSAIAAVLTDRRQRGYKGAWRYRVVSGDNEGRTLFKRRSDGAGFAGMVRLNGWAAAMRYLDQCGCRVGIDFKDDRHD